MEHGILRELAPPEALPSLLEYSEMLATDGRRLGLVGFPASDAQLHVARALLLYPLLLDGPFLDVGSGAGLPGVPLALLRPGTGNLLEPRRKAVAFLEKARRDLKGRFTVIHERAETHADRRAAYPTVVARALAEPQTALELCAPLTRPGGRILLTGSPGGEFDIPRSERDRLGLEKPIIEKLSGALELTQWVHIIQRSADRPSPN